MTTTTQTLFTAAVSSGVTLIVAGLGFWITFRNSRRLSERKDRLERINRQLSELYGPMLALCSAADISWRTFMSQYSKGDLTAFDIDGNPLVDEEEWMTWMRAVMMPLNRQLAEKILHGGDLLIEQEIPQALLEFAAHVSSWEAVFAKWDRGDTRQLTAGVNHPGRVLFRYAQASYLALKSSQAKLLDTRRGRE